MSAANTPTTSRHTFWRATGIVFLILLIAGAVVVHQFRKQLPPEIMKDIRAGIAARKITDPDLRFQKFLENLYGPMTDPANRQRAFLDFFDVNHIRALQLIVRHSPDNQRKANIDATARWIEHYRQSLTDQDRASLTAYLQSAEGSDLLHRATAQYNSQDVEYRGQTAPVISQLLKTIASVQK